MFQTALVNFPRVSYAVGTGPLCKVSLSPSQLSKSLLRSGEGGLSERFPLALAGIRRDFLKFKKKFNLGVAAVMRHISGLSAMEPPSVHEIARTAVRPLNGH